jgi:homogentisate 1,2-dioxygenase
MREFSARHGSVRILFGNGSSTRLAAEIQSLGLERVLVVCTPGRKAAALSLAIGEVSALAREHTPVESVNAARADLERTRADAVLAIGGGSALGLAKALALSSSVRIVAVPTTYSGSEMTPVYGITEGAVKKTGRDERVRPSLVIYDPVLTYALPIDVTVKSLWNAMAHAVEALWSNIDRSTALTAEEALRLLSRAMQRLSIAPSDPIARDEAFEGAYLAGASFSDAGSGLHHRICHALGGAFGMPHAATHAALLPHVVRFQRAHAPDAMLAIARALGAIDPVVAIERLARATNVDVGLAALGMPREGIDRIAKTIGGSGIAQLLETAWNGPKKRETQALRGPDAIVTESGFGSTHESEALDGALPRGQNAPRRAPFGLYPELVNGTPFTVRNAENSRVWLYRVRAAFSHAPFTPLPSAHFAAPLEDVTPNRMRWRPHPIPTTPVDFLDGLVTLGGGGDLAAGPGYAVHLYAASAAMDDRALSNADGDLLIVPQEGDLDCRTELGWLRAGPGKVILVPRGIKFSIGVPSSGARGFVLEVLGSRLRLPERGLIGSNGLADARHFQAPVASFEDRACDFQIVHKMGGRLFAAQQAHSPFDVVAWHGNHVPYSYDLSLFSPMGSVRVDHPDPSILTVLSAPLDDHGRAIADFVIFPGRWEVTENSFRPPFMHRNAASEVNMVIRTPSPEHGYDPGCVFLTPLLTSHGVSTKTYDAIAALPEDHVDPPRRLPDESLWAMFESALPFRLTSWARETTLVDPTFLALFDGMKSRFDRSAR